MNLNVEDKIRNKVPEFMYVFRDVLEKIFVQKDYSINAKIIVQELKHKNIDIIKLKKFMEKLPDGQWNLKIFLDNIEDINTIFGISNEEITKLNIEEIDEKDLPQLKWSMLIEMMTEYSRFSTEFYDALKYNETGGLSISQLKLLNEVTLTFKLIKEISSELYKQYGKKKLSSSNLENFNKERLIIEYLFLRLVYISMNIEKANDEKFEKFARLLGMERISLTYQVTYKKLYN